MNINSLEKTVNILVSIATFFAIFFGGAFAIIEYKDYKKEVKIKHALEFVNRYNQGFILQSRQEEYKAWQRNQKTLIESIKNYESRISYKKIILNFMEREGIDSSVSYILNFFEDIAICASSKICDEDTINRYFFISGRTYIHKYYPYICDQRSKWNDPTIWKRLQNFYKPNFDKDFCSEE